MQRQTQSVAAFLPTLFYTDQQYVEICNNKISLLHHHYTLLLGQ